MDEGAEIIDLSREIQRRELLRAKKVASFDAARGYEKYGFPNTIAFLKARCDLSAAAAIQVLTVARRLAELPAVEAAVEQGQIGFQQAAVIAESSELLAERQEEVVAKAEELDPSRLRQAVRRIAMQVDAERMRREAEWAYRSRRLQVTTLGDGRIRLDGLLDSEGGAALKTALDAALGPRAMDEARSEAQRKADALADIARRALEGRRFGQTGGQRPHVNITVELETLIGLRDEPATLNGNAPLVLDTVERYLCDASVSITALLDAKPVLAGDERRTFSGPLRRALKAKVSHCEHESGCDRPVEWCEGHHVLPWLLGGRTTAANGRLLCSFHHRLAHSPPAA